MTPLLSLSRLIDLITTGVGKFAMWLILATTLISAGNAVVRKAFNVGSNGLLEIQWYLFAAVFLLSAGYGFMKNSHVRIDFISSHLSARSRNWVDVAGIVAVLFPFCLLSIALSWPLFTQRTGHRRDVAKRGRPDSLAGLCADSDRFCVACHARRL